MALNIQADDLVENPTPRLPVCLCLDTSGSMLGDKINELLEGVKLFYDTIDEDDDTHDSVEVSIVAFNSGANLIQDFTGSEAIDRDLTIEPSGLTFMGEGVNLALDTLEKRKELYSSKGVLYYQPWLVLITDGKPEGGSEQEVDRAVSRVEALVAKRKLTVFPIGVGLQPEGEKILARFSPLGRPPLRLKGLAFKEFFEWLSMSASKASQSMPGAEPSIDFGSIRGIEDL